MKFALILGVLAAATVGSAGAAMVSYNTAGTTFACSSPSCSVNNSNVGPFGITPLITFTSGANIATVTYTGPGPGPANVPIGMSSNINYGFFTFTCVVCGPTDVVAIPAFTVALILNDVTDSGTTTFNGTSAAGNITASSNGLGVTWSPTSASFAGGNTLFSIENRTPFPTDNSTAGQVTIRGNIVIASSVPEPGSMFLLGAGLIGVGFTARKKFASRS